ncbi:GNAT family N-acetyltransferase [soil metagenome]
MRDEPSLSTERLVLRRWTEADRDPFAAMNADPEVMRYFPGTLSREHSDALVDRFERGFATDGFSQWVVEVKGGPAFLGFAGIWRLPDTNPHAGAVEVGWRLARGAWHRGYATEAARAAVAYGFDVVGLSEIVSMTAAVNRPSRAVMERLGMTCDLADDFDHPAVATGPLRRHVLYRLRRSRRCDPPRSAAPGGSERLGTS